MARAIHHGATGASKPFKYLNKGALAGCGPPTRGVRSTGLKLWGPPAFFIYLAVHLYYLGGPRGRRIEVLLRWIGTGFGERQSALVQGDLSEIERGPSSPQNVS